MADCADVAEKNIEIQLANQIRDAKQGRVIEPDIENGRSYCLFCGEDLGEVKEGETVRRWCNSSCRDLWERENQKH